jgi:hypothetical protein
MPGPLIFRKPVEKGEMARFMVFTIEPSPMPIPKRSLHGKFKEATARVSLKTHTSDNLTFFSSRLVF